MGSVERRQFLKAAGLSMVALSAASLRAEPAGDSPPALNADTVPGPTLRKRPTGYAARALMKDDSLVPVRGQTARLIPQPEVDYAISYDSQNVYTIPRRDGLIVQEWSPGDYGNENEVASLEATRTSVEKIARLCAQMAQRVEATGA
jgi:hypothetical protein